MRPNNERSLLSLIELVSDNLRGVELMLMTMTSPEGDHAANGLAEVGVREIKAQTRTLMSQLVQRLGSRIDEKDPLTSWIPRHPADCVSRYRLMDDGPTLDQRRCGETWKRPVLELAESVHFKQVGENNARRRPEEAARCPCGSSRDVWCRNLPHASWCEAGNENREDVGA